ncbi:hypothetical protein HDE_00220 [Halotydeus destructor]|nr:hypothetical protein HDE_00220 [Halotydeus destructor]
MSIFWALDIALMARDKVWMFLRTSGNGSVFSGDWAGLLPTLADGVVAVWLAASGLGVGLSGLEVDVTGEPVVTSLSLNVSGLPEVANLLTAASEPEAVLWTGEEDPVFSNLVVAPPRLTSDVADGKLTMVMVMANVHNVHCPAIEIEIKASEFEHYKLRFV